jgi:hypothetical protein
MTRIAQPYTPIRRFRCAIFLEGPLKYLGVRDLKWDGACLVASTVIKKDRPSLIDELRGGGGEKAPGMEVRLMIEDATVYRAWRLQYERLLNRGPINLSAESDDGYAMEAVAFVNAELVQIPTNAISSATEPPSTKPDVTAP